MKPEKRIMDDKETEKNVYMDVCDMPFVTKAPIPCCHVRILRLSPEGEVYEDEPTDYECGIFSRNWRDSGLIDKDTAYKLLLNPRHAYDEFARKNYSLEELLEGF